MSSLPLILFINRKYMGIILADGQCHHSIYVETAPGAGPGVAQQIKERQDAIRGAGEFKTATADELAHEIRAIPGVTRVIPAGPRSALPLALRMACGLTGRRGVFATHNGQGAAADAIRDGLRNGNIDLLMLQELEGDMPVSFMVVDSAKATEHETVTLYPLSRKKYRHRSVYPSTLLDDCDAFLLNRANQGMLDSARRAFPGGTLVNLRIHGYSRHVTFDDYRPLLPFVHHLVIDSGHNSLRDTAKALGLHPPRGWPDQGDAPLELLQQLAAALNAIAGHPLLHAYVINGRNTLHLLGSAGHASATKHPVLTPGKICDLKITARSHGAMLAAALLAKPSFDIDPASRQPRSEAGLQAMANWMLAAAQHGLLNLPWQWPGFDFDPNHLQLELP